MGLPTPGPPIESDSSELRAPRPRPSPAPLRSLWLLHQPTGHLQLRRRAFPFGKELVGHDVGLGLGGAATGDRKSKDLHGAWRSLFGDLDDDVRGDRTIVLSLGGAGSCTCPLLLSTRVLLYGSCLVEIPLLSHSKAGSLAIPLDKNRTFPPTLLPKSNLFPFPSLPTSLFMYPSS